jgi:hypothetical protein
MSALFAAIVALVVALLPAPVAPAPVAGHAGPEPGPGWFLATIADEDEMRLVVIEPDGTRHPVLERDNPGWGLADWSPDGTTALLSRQLSDHHRVLLVGITTGAAELLDLPGDVSDAVLAPDGDGLLVVSFGGLLSLLARDGTSTPLDQRVSGPLLIAPDGTTLLTNGARWQQKVMRVLDAATGEVVDQIPVGGHCQPVRWWDAHRALLNCDGSLSLLDPATGTLQVLTHRHNRSIGDFGHLDARRIDSGLYLEISGACGYVFLGQKYPDGRVTKLVVPHTDGNLHLLGGAGRRLVIQHVGGCERDGPRSVMSRFDPVTGEERPIVALRPDRWLGAVLAYGVRALTEY